MLRMSKSRGILAAVLVAVISMSWTDVQAGGASISDGPSGGDALRVVVLSNNSDGRDDTSQLATPEGFAQMRADQGTKVDMLVVDDAELEQLNPGRVEAFLNNGTILWVRGKKITPADVYASLSIAGSPGEISYGGFEQTGIYLYLLNGQVLCGLTGNALFVPSGMTEAEKARHADVVMDPVIDLQELAAGLRNDVGRITGNLACKIATETENDPIYTPLEAPSSSGIHDPANDIVTVNLNMVNLYNSIIGTAGVTQYRYLIYRFYRRSGTAGMRHVSLQHHMRRHQRRLCDAQPRLQHQRPFDRGLLWAGTCRQSGLCRWRQRQCQRRHGIRVHRGFSRYRRGFRRGRRPGGQYPTYDVVVFESSGRNTYRHAQQPAQRMVKVVDNACQ